MVKKQFAYLKNTSGFKVVTIFRAIKMKNAQIKNKDEKLLFYDVPNEKKGELLVPKKSSSNGRCAHFSYYPKSSRSGANGKTSMTHNRGFGFA